VTPADQLRGEMIDGCGALRQDQAVPASIQCRNHVIEDQQIPRVVGGKRAVDVRNRAWDGSRAFSRRSSASSCSRSS